MSRDAAPVDLARAIVRGEIIHLAPLVDVARIELGVSHVRGEAGVRHVPLSDAESVARLYDRVGWHPKEKGAVHAASHAQLLRDGVHSAVAAVADEDRVFAWPQNNVAVFTVVDRHLLAVIEDVDLAALQIVHDELLPSDPAALPAHEARRLRSWWWRRRWSAQWLPGALPRSSAGANGVVTHSPGFLTTSWLLRFIAI